MDKVLDILLSNGPMGVVAAAFFFLLWQERKDHKETREALVETVNKYEVLVQSAVEAMTKVTTLISERVPNKNQGGGDG